MSDFLKISLSFKKSLAPESFVTPAFIFHLVDLIPVACTL